MFQLAAEHSTSDLDLPSLFREALQVGEGRMKTFQIELC